MDSDGLHSYPFNPRLSTVCDIILAREQLGMGFYNRKMRETTTQLASRIAWNPTRMQNMILVVGPGTPASTCLSQVPSSSDGQSSSSSVADHDGEEESVDGNRDLSGDEMNVQTDNSHNDEMDRDCDKSDEEQDNCEDNVDSAVRMHRILQGHLASTGRSQDMSEHFLDWMDSNGEDSESEDEEPDYCPARKNQCVPSLRHGGCINTAAWLTSPWRLSLCGGGEGDAVPVFSDECPTQLITSGDDRLVKFWDVRFALGMSTPLAGGIDTVCPFSCAAPSVPPNDEWNEFQSKSAVPISGSVIPLASIQTSHFGNVFHVTPLDHDPGKVVTCGADGYLRSCDLISGRSTIIVSPEYGDIPQVFGYRGSRMCFSHHFIDSHTGLLCSGSGLFRFDMRLKPREQQRRSMLTQGAQCKACAIYSYDSDVSAYVFAGGESPNVGLYDLRMSSDEGSSHKVVQLYRPRGLARDAMVSVSGIDLSRNKKEMLISYENDQIYTFPICPKTLCASGPSVDEMLELAQQMNDNETIQSELCVYGGHLNRFTFLKNAKYAGPSDEYICTGSDSGHGWIYQKSTGSVVSFLKADGTTCNGVIPHPSLPMFITYGIDSTAKLWRATLPVDKDLDDSPVGRATFFHTKPYRQSSLVNNWTSCKEKLIRLERVASEENACIMPDQIPKGNSIDSGYSPIMNDMQNLPEVLRKNLFACILARDPEEDHPVRSSIDDLRRRISLMCLRHQADQRGLILTPEFPWKFEFRPHVLQSSLCNDNVANDLHRCNTDPVDLIPESPSDWLPYDSEMTSKPRASTLDFNLEDYEEFYRRHYASSTRNRSAAQVKNDCSLPKNILDIEGSPTPDNLKNGQTGKAQLNGCSSGSSERFEQESLQSSSLLIRPPCPGDATQLVSNQTERALKKIFDVVSALKDSGNNALRAGLVNLAARRYDQAVGYCAVVFMRYPRGNLNLVPMSAKADATPEWTPLLKLLVTTRLNLSMVLMKLPEPEPRLACEMALIAIVELQPFACVQGTVLAGFSNMKVVKDDEPESTFLAAKELEAKAFFRVGSAQCALRDYSAAVESFKMSICSSEAIGRRPDPLVQRRLEEATQAVKVKNKKLRKKMRRAFGAVGDNL